MKNPRANEAEYFGSKDDLTEEKLQRTHEMGRELSISVKAKYNRFAHRVFQFLGLTYFVLYFTTPWLRPANEDARLFLYFFGWTSLALLLFWSFCRINLTQAFRISTRGLDFSAPGFSSTHTEGIRTGTMLHFPRGRIREILITPIMYTWPFRILSSRYRGWLLMSPCTDGIEEERQLEKDRELSDQEQRDKLNRIIAEQKEVLRNEGYPKLEEAYAKKRSLFWKIVHLGQFHRKLLFSKHTTEHCFDLPQPDYYKPLLNHLCHVLGIPIRTYYWCKGCKEYREELNGHLVRRGKDLILQKGVKTTENERHQLHARDYDFLTPTTD